MADEIRRWSEELAGDPQSLVFLPLGEALRRQGDSETALRIATRGLERHPNSADAHDLVARIAADRGELERAAEEWSTVLRLAPANVGALKGLGFVCFRQGKLEEAERYLREAASHGADDQIDAALAAVNRSVRARTPDSPAARVTPPSAAPSQQATSGDPQRIFADLLVEDDQTGLLLDEGGLVLGGAYVNSEGEDIASEVGAELSGISDEARRTTRHLKIGGWRSIVVETEVAVVAMAPAAADSLVVIAASNGTALGLLRRLLDRCSERAAAWLEART